MYTRPDRRRASQGFAGACVREVPAEFHEGTCEDFLRRHEIEAVSAARGTNRQRQRFAGCLLRRAADSRNLRLAIEHLAAKGGPAPGPNGLRLRDLDDQERWDLARMLSRAIRSGQYRPGPSRKVMIPKGPGRGHRPLRLQNVEDRAVQRAIVQVVQPFVDLHFRLSFGYRPGLGREHALATAEQLALAGNLWVWITEDVKDAFENVPHGRLLDVVQRQVPAEDLVELIGLIIYNRRNKGIRQGSPLSPLLLNLYLHWLLDRRWLHAYPDTPLLRAADDLLVLCQSIEQAQEAYRNLKQAVRQAGMALKGNPEGAIRELAAGQEAHWLGYRLCKEGSGLRISLTERSWHKLEEGLMLAHEEPDAPLAANRVILGWASQQGAAYREGDLGRVYAGIASRAERQGFTEAPGREEVAARWRRGYSRWLRVRRELLLSSSSLSLPASLYEREGSADGSARQHGDSAALRGRPSEAPDWGVSGELPRRGREVE